MTLRDQYEGCLLGLALGDACGAPFEGGPLERLLWRLIGTTGQGERRWTDDTQMSIDLAESLLATGRVVPDDLARRFAAGYRWSRGYGPGAARVLKRIARGAGWQQASRSVYPEGSYGNGGAMRSPVVGLFYANRPDDLIEAVKLSASVTHAHPLAAEGAILIAAATATALTSTDREEFLRDAAANAFSAPYRKRLAVARDWLLADAMPPAAEVGARLGNGIAAIESTVTALYAALRCLDRPFDELLHYIRGVGGDVDTIGAMAGAIWGAVRGRTALPDARLQKLEKREYLQQLAGQLYVQRLT